ncbi:hypothetical protein N2152v2_010746 [Parachlorella kessleri]
MTALVNQVLAGRLPNVYYEFVSLETLRLLPSYKALCPVDWLVTSGTPSYRQYCPPQHPASPRGTASSAAEVAAAAELHNALAVERFNAGKAARPSAQQGSSVAPSAGAGGSKSKSRNRRDRKARREQQQQQHDVQTRSLAEMECAETTVNGEEEQPRVSRQSKLGGLSEDEKLRLARSLGQQGFNAICCAWGKVQEPASLRALATLLGPSSQLVEVGFCRLDCKDLPQEWGFEPGSLPPLGASPDALVHHTLLDLHDSLGSAGQVPLPPQLVTVSAAGSCANGYATSSGCGAGSRGSSPGRTGDGHLSGPLAEQLGGLQLAQGMRVKEVVEVKNTCPFGVNQHRGQRGSPAELYLLSDRGPRHDVKPEWVPQLQLHMLCAGTRTALLVSRSATKGLHVFRMARDDDYLQLMLRVLSRFWSEFVQRQRQPPQDMFSSWAHYHRLLQQTVLIARSAELALRASSSRTPYGDDCRLFLD